MSISNSFIACMSIYTSLGLMSILKSLNHEARPFFVADLRPTAKCWNEYGDPSGHSQSSAVLYFTVWKLMCVTYNPRPWVRKISMILTGLLVFGIGFSRMY